MKKSLNMFNLSNAFNPAMTTSRMVRRGLALFFAMPLTVALLLLGGNAFADTYTIDVEGGPNNQGLDTTRGESIWMQENGVNESQFFVGVLFITLTDTNGGVWYRDTVCVDLFTEINIDSTYGTTILSPADVPGKTNLNRVAWLVDNAMLPVNNTNYVSQLPSSDWVTNAAQGAGIQLAIWDIVENNGDGLSAGSVQASTDLNNPTPSDVLYWANFYETQSLNQSSGLAYVYDNVNLSTGAPAQMLEGPLFTDGGPMSAPEPSTCQFMLVSLAGGIGLWFKRRR
jgi:hypothetical protein